MRGSDRRLDDGSWPNCLRAIREGIEEAGIIIDRKACRLQRAPCPARDPAQSRSGGFGRWSDEGPTQSEEAKAVQLTEG